MGKISNQMDFKMFLIEKKSEVDFYIYLDPLGAKEIINYIDEGLKGQLELNEGSTGLQNIPLSFFVIEHSICEISFLNQEASTLEFILGTDDKKYLYSRLKEFLEVGHFSPQKLFTLEYRHSNVNFLLMPQSK